MFQKFDEGVFSFIEDIFIVDLDLESTALVSHLLCAEGKAFPKGLSCLQADDFS
jgi:hypothetical protein